MIVLSVPYKRVHPELASNYEVDDDGLDGLDFLDDDDLEMINEEDLNDDDLENNTPEEDSDKNKKTDPRWDKLKQLLTDK